MEGILALAQLVFAQLIGSTRLAARTAVLEARADVDFTAVGVVVIAVAEGFTALGALTILTGSRAHVVAATAVVTVGQQVGLISIGHVLVAVSIVLEGDTARVGAHAVGLVTLDAASATVILVAGEIDGTTKVANVLGVFVAGHESEILLATTHVLVKLGVQVALGGRGAAATVTASTGGRCIVELLLAAVRGFAVAVVVVLIAYTDTQFTVLVGSTLDVAVTTMIIGSADIGLARSEGATIALLTERVAHTLRKLAHGLSGIFIDIYIGSFALGVTVTAVVGIFGNVRLAAVGAVAVAVAISWKTLAIITDAVSTEHCFHVENA